MSISSSSTLAQLQYRFPDAIMIDAHDMATVLGISYKTLNNQGGAFPIKPVRFGRRKLFRIVDIAAYIDEALGITEATKTSELVGEPSPIPIEKRGRGRPRKACAVEVRA